MFTNEMPKAGAMNPKLKADVPTPPLFGMDSADDVITAIDGKRDQVSVLVDLLYPYFSHVEAGEKELFFIKTDFTRIRTYIEIISDALTDMGKLVERWNEIADTFCESNMEKKGSSENER